MENIQWFVAGVAGWFVAAVLLGLYLGERGRRQDAQRREGKIRVDPTPRAVVTGAGREDDDDAAPAQTRTASATDMAIASGTLADRAAAKARYIDTAVGEGFDKLEAAADFELMYANAMSGHAGGPSGGLLG